MKQKLAVAFGILVLLLGFNVSIQPGQFRAMAQAGVCQFAGYGAAGQLINTTITCSTPSTGPQATPAAGNCIAITTPPPAGTIAVSGVGCTPPALPLSIANGGTGTAAPAPTGTNGCTVGTFPSLVVSCPSSAPQLTPSPSATATSTAGAPSFTISGSFPYTYAVNFPSGGTGITLQPATPTPSPQTGSGAITGTFFAGNFLANYNGSAAGGFFSFANSSTSNDVGFTYSTFTTNDAATHKGALFADNSNEGNIVLGGGASDYIYSANNVSLDSCSSCQVNVHYNDGNTNGLAVRDGGTTNFVFYKVGVSGTSVLPAKGQVSCALSTLTCTATATVASGDTCTASYDGVATTVTFALLLPLEASVSSTTLTVKMQGAATATGTAAADYVCI